MADKPVMVYPTLDSIKVTASAPGAGVIIESSSCAESEPFALRVIDDSMQPEFRKGCIIIIDPTGVARDGSYVFARTGGATAGAPSADGQGVIGDFTFRQLQQRDGHWFLVALNHSYPPERTRDDLSDITGVIVQRAGVRRRYHKRYD